MTPTNSAPLKNASETSDTSTDFFPFRLTAEDAEIAEKDKYIYY